MPSEHKQSDREHKMKYYPIIGIDPKGDEDTLELPLDFTTPELINALTWYIENGWTLRGLPKVAA